MSPILICMFIFCILSITFLIIAICYMVELDEKASNMCILFGVLFISITLFLMYYTPKMSLEKSYSFNIYAMKDTAQIKGSRFYFEEDFKYYYLRDYKGGKKMYGVDKDDAYIIETSEQNPHIEVYKSKLRTKNKIIKWLYGDFKSYYEYKIVVPEETLTNEFEIDLEK